MHKQQKHLWRQKRKNIYSCVNSIANTHFSKGLLAATLVSIVDVNRSSTVVFFIVFDETIKQLFGQVEDVGQSVHGGCILNDSVLKWQIHEILSDSCVLSEKKCLVCSWRVANWAQSKKHLGSFTDFRWGLALRVSFSMIVLNVSL